MSSSKTFYSFTGFNISINISLFVYLCCETATRTRKNKNYFVIEKSFRSEQRKSFLVVSNNRVERWAHLSSINGLEFFPIHAQSRLIPAHRFLLTKIRQKSWEMLEKFLQQIFSYFSDVIYICLPQSNCNQNSWVGRI